MRRNRRRSRSSRSRRMTKAATTLMARGSVAEALTPKPPMQPPSRAQRRAQADASAPKSPEMAPTQAQRMPPRPPSPPPPNRAWREEPSGSSGPAERLMPCGPDGPRRLNAHGVFVDQPRTPPDRRQRSPSVDTWGLLERQRSPSTSPVDEEPTPPVEPPAKRPRGCRAGRKKEIAIIRSMLRQGDARGAQQIADRAYDREHQKWWTDP